MSGRRTRLFAIGVALGVAVAAIALLAWPTPSRDATTDAPTDGVTGLPDPLPWQDVTWERLDPPAMGGPLAQTAVGITRVPDGLLVLGSDADGMEGAQEQVGAVWLSRDARSWALQRIVDGVPPGDTAELRVAAGGPAGTVLVGGVCCSREEPAMWLATTGVAFERIPLPEAARRVTFLDVEAGPAGFVAVGTLAEGDENDPRYAGEIWTSADGRTWSRVDPVQVDLGEGWVTDVLWTGSAWVAVGHDDDGETSDGAVWHSADGQTWERDAVVDPAMNGPDEVGLTRVLRLADGLFAQGGLGTQEDRERCEDALGQAEDIVGVDDAVLVRSCGWASTTHWTSPDGSTWTLMPPLDRPGPGGRRLVSHRVLESGGPGLVAVDAEGTTPDGHDSIGTWTTGDGGEWRPVGAAGQLADGLFLNDLFVVDRTIVGVGESPWDQPTGFDIVVWIGTVRP